MTKLDKHNRLYIPAAIYKGSNIDYKKPIRIFRKNNFIFLDNMQSKYKYNAHLGNAYIDNRHKLYLPKKARDILEIDLNSDIIIYLSMSKIFIAKKNIPYKARRRLIKCQG